MGETVVFLIGMYAGGALLIVMNTLIHGSVEKSDVMYMLTWPIVLPFVVGAHIANKYMKGENSE